MDHPNSTPVLLEQIQSPAFIVENGKITEVNTAAAQKGITAKTEISSLIYTGKTEYEAYDKGKLCLTLQLSGVTCKATVTNLDFHHLFCLESDYEEPELRAFSLAALQLREPLTNAMINTDLLLPNPAVQNDPVILKQMSQINRNLHQLLRAVCNMSDASLYGDGHFVNLQQVDAVSVFAETLEKATVLTKQSGRELKYKIPNQRVICPVDTPQLQRAILNLISNAVKYSNKNSTIHAELRHSSNRLIFSVWDDGNAVSAEKRKNLFSAYLREPGISADNSGIGLGMTIVHSIAAAHGGTLLIEQPENSGLKVTFTVCTKTDGTLQLRSPIMLPIDHSGGRDHALVELSDALSDSLYDGKF